MQVSEIWMLTEPHMSNKKSFDQIMGDPMRKLKSLTEPSVDVSKETIKRMIIHAWTKAEPIEQYEPAHNYWQGYVRACEEILEIDGQ